MAIEQHIADALHEVDELAPALNRGPGARELSLAKTKLEEAELWLTRSRERFEAPSQPSQ
jgi:hypothetical protein